MNKEKNIVNLGQSVELEITAIGSKGDGIGRYNNFVIIVPKTNIGRIYLVEVTKVLKRFAFGKVIEELSY